MQRYDLLDELGTIYCPFGKVDRSAHQWSENPEEFTGEIAEPSEAERSDHSYALVNFGAVIAFLAAAKAFLPFRVLH